MLRRHFLSQGSAVRFWGQAFVFWDGQACAYTRTRDWISVSHSGEGSRGTSEHPQCLWADILPGCISRFMIVAKEPFSNVPVSFFKALGDISQDLHASNKCVLRRFQDEGLLASEFLVLSR